MVDQKDGTKLPENADVNTRAEGTTLKEKIKLIKAKSSDRNHPYYWDKLMVLELVEMALSSVNLYQAFRLDVWNSEFSHVLIIIFLAITLELISIVEYCYVRFRMFPSQVLSPVEKKEKINGALTLFTTKQIIADTMHLYAALELKSFIMFF